MVCLGDGISKELRLYMAEMQSAADWLFGTAPELQKVATGTRQQQKFGGKDLIGLLRQMMGQGGGFNAANQYDQSILQGGPGQQGGAYQQFSQPYLQEFEQQILPQIAERFAGMGALSSSGFGQALGGAASGLQSQLAQLFSQMQGQASGRQQGQFQNLSQIGLGYNPFAYHEKQGTEGFIKPAATAAIKGYSGG